MSAKFSGSLISESEKQFWNALAPRVLTVLGISILVRLPQPLKQSVGICVAALGISIVVRDEHGERLETTAGRLIFNEAVRKALA